MISSVRRSIRHTAALYIVLISAAVFGLEGWREWSTRAELLLRAESAALNIARSVVNQAESAFGLAEQTIAATAFLLEDGFGHDHDGKLDALLEAQVGYADDLSGIYVYDAQGRLIENTSAPPVYGPERDAVDLVAPHAAQSTRRTRFNGMMQDPDGNWLSVLSRRIDQPDGSFAGVVAVGISSAALSDAYGRLAYGPHGSISLLATGDANRVIAHGPDDALRIGSVPDLAGAAALDQGDQVHPPTRQDGERIVSIVQSKRYPFAVLSTASNSDIVALWATDALPRIVVILAFGIGLLAMGIRASYHSERRLQSELALREREAEYRLLAESASDLVERFDELGNRLYISPAVERLLGYTVSDLLGRSVFEDIHEDDLPDITVAARRLLSNESSQETIVFRRPHKDGRIVWLETSLRVANDGPQAGSVVGVTRDVTKRKQLEKQLQLMARIDGLTGLANRGTFDATFAQEVERANRSGQPLALLLFDADRFKRYNDQHGHLAGDNCLRAISDVLKTFARRPDDLAARYGGEEFALLLPGSDVAAARDTATRIVRRIEALAIPHALNPPWTMVTVSVGVAVMNAGGTACAEAGSQLIERVDAALYRAKSEGRNRWVMARSAEQGTRLVS